MGAKHAELLRKQVINAKLLLNKAPLHVLVRPFQFAIRATLTVLTATVPVPGPLTSRLPPPPPLLPPVPITESLR